MYRRIDDFIQDWESEAANTSKLFDMLTDASLGQAVAPGCRTIARLTWHIAQTIPEMMNRTGLNVEGIDIKSLPPLSVEAIKAAYDEVSLSMVNEVQNKWTDESLEQEDNLYGENWKRGFTLSVLMLHQAHHRGQLTVLMRQAGLKVAGVCGPAREEWAEFGHPEPIV